VLLLLLPQADSASAIKPTPAPLRSRFELKSISPSGKKKAGQV
jgi:hypothetical protein